jgi:hypothetical protein
MTRAENACFSRSTFPNQEAAWKTAACIGGTLRDLEALAGSSARTVTLRSPA